MRDKEMKLTKDRFSTWEDLNDKDYEIEFDDELIIRVEPNEKSKDIADYILSLQDELDRLLIKHDEVREELGNMKLTGTPRKHPYCLICEKMYMDFCMLHCGIKGSYEMRINND
jgi:hypothetical protein